MLFPYYSEQLRMKIMQLNYPRTSRSFVISEISNPSTRIPEDFINGKDSAYPNWVR